LSAFGGLTSDAALYLNDMTFLTVAIVFGLGIALVFAVAALLLKGLDRLQTVPPDYCSFCNRHTRDAGTLVPAPALYICHACVRLLTDIISDDETDVQGAPSQNDESPMRTARCRVCGRHVRVRGTVPVAHRGALCRECLAIVRKTERLLGDPSDA
jgi:hypothetical protein